MKKHLITGGCSFSHYNSSDNWAALLYEHLKQINPNITCEHTGYRSQGQDMIHKKVMLACMEAMERGIKGSDIIVTIMWSGTYRKAWYITNTEIIQKMVSHWATYEGGMSPQLLTLKNQYGERVETFVTSNNSQFEYSYNGGWYFTVDGSDCPLSFVQEYYMLDGYPQYGIGKTHYSLENIISLQNFCKLHGIKMIQQFFMDFVFKDIEQHKNDMNIKYLYKQLDMENIITEGVFDYLHQFIGIERHEAMLLSHTDRKKLNGNLEIFQEDGFHPGKTGYKLWFNNILKPFLTERI